MNVIKRNLFLVILFTTLPSFALAQITCRGANIGGFAAGFGSQSTAQSWVADSVTFDENSVHYFENHANEEGLKYKFKFYWEGMQWRGSYNPGKKMLSVKMIPTGNFKNIPALRYPDCTEGASSGSSQRQPDAVQAAFTTSSSCQRKFVQSYLRTAALYKSTIDGQWGPGTRSAIQAASKRISRFKGDKLEDIIKALRSESPC